MADRIYLSGGPCDGKTVSANQIQGGLVGYIACGGGYYTADSQGKLHNGDPVFDYAGKTQPGPPGGSGPSTPHVHHGWRDLRRSINHNMPHGLAQAQHLTRLALRATSKGGKVRH